MHGLIDNLEVRYVNAAVSASSSIDDNSVRIDMDGYESVVFIVTITDSVATGVATLKVEHSDTDADTYMTAVTGAEASLTSAVNDDLNEKVLVVEYRNPAKRYVQAVLTSATANIAYGETIAILKPKRLPAVRGATVGKTAYVSN